ncbi:MAG: peptidoglycan DD-metalloendopeptidase family protein [Salinibacterium sp.]|nr:peptidoglycan DD-metalloendopeptidase family protein [Salinibacterium sp.]MBF0672730.1 peptidoglycan DD-metalloendopeptidase family protein [Salinibacterium sp.]
MKQHTTKTRRSRSLVATLAVLGVLLTGGLTAQGTQAAHAADYPSWQDVLAARSSESAKKNEIARLERLLAQLEANVASTEAEAMAKGDEFIVAQQAYDEAAYRFATLEQQVIDAKTAADESMTKAGQLAARLQRAGGGDLTAQLLFTDSDDLLGQLGRATKVGEQSSGIFAKAKQDENAAKALSDQAKVAEEALAGLAAEAETAMIEAQQAADAANAALQEQAGNRERLEAQLSVLRENRAATEADFAIGEQIRLAEEARKRAEEEARRQAAAAAAAAAAAEAAKNRPSPSTPTAPSQSGWVRPTSGYISSSYGWRVPPTNGASTLHGGVDFAPGCGAPIYAASAGTVVFAGMTGGYGNYVKINHGDGSQSAYAHIRPGGIAVGYGQWVSAGQVIAYVGTTGISTGCHLHFEIRVGGSTVDPVPYLRARGVGV